MKTHKEMLADKLESARVRTQERLFKDFVACKDDDARKVIGAKMDVLGDLVNVFKKELNKTTE